MTEQGAQPLIVAGVVLAAGGSRRFGAANKLLQPVAGRPMVAHAVATVQAAPLDARAIVLGCESAAVSAALSAFEVSVLINDQWADGMATSMHCAVRWARDAVGATHLLVMLGDMPFITPTHISALLQQARKHPHSIIRAMHGGKAGNPVVLPHDAFAGLMQAVGDQGARQLIEGGFATTEVELDDAVRADIDTPDSLAQFAAGHRR